MTKINQSSSSSTNFAQEAQVVQGPGTGGPNITPEQALTVITSAVRQLKLSYDEHVYLDQCVKIVQEKVTE